MGRLWLDSGEEKPDQNILYEKITSNLKSERKKEDMKFGPKGKGNKRIIC